MSTMVTLDRFAWSQSAETTVSAAKAAAGRNRRTASRPTMIFIFPLIIQKTSFYLLTGMGFGLWISSRFVRELFFRRVSVVRKPFLSSWHVSQLRVLSVRLRMLWIGESQ